MSFNEQPTMGSLCFNLSVASAGVLLRLLLLLFKFSSSFEVMLFFFVLIHIYALAWRTAFPGGNTTTKTCVEEIWFDREVNKRGSFWKRWLCWKRWMSTLWRGNWNGKNDRYKWSLCYMKLELFFSVEPVGSVSFCCLCGSFSCQMFGITWFGRWALPALPTRGQLSEVFLS